MTSISLTICSLGEKRLSRVSFTLESVDQSPYFQYYSNATIISYFSQEHIVKVRTITYEPIKPFEKGNNNAHFI